MIPGSTQITTVKGGATLFILYTVHGLTLVTFAGLLPRSECKLSMPSQIKRPALSCPYVWNKSLHLFFPTAGDLLSCSAETNIGARHFLPVHKPAVTDTIINLGSSPQGHVGNKQLKTNTGFLLHIHIALIWAPKISNSGRGNEIRVNNTFRGHMSV